MEDKKTDQSAMGSQQRFHWGGIQSHDVVEIKVVEEDYTRTFFALKDVLIMHSEVFAAMLKGMTETKYIYKQSCS